MKISLEWLRDYVKADLPVPELVDRLTMIGLVADSVEETAGDTVLDIETYANRPDTLGHLGIARETAAMLDKPLEPEDWPLAELPEKTSDLTDIQIQDEALCPRYCALIVKDVAVGPSPDWLRRRLDAIGLRPINNLVDVTNYVLFATGQPIHAFDFAKLGGSRIVVRRARRGEALVDLEGRRLELEPDMLVIADESDAVALAGVIGGQASAVSEGTRDVLIESANFDPVSVRLTARRLGLATDASYRFERGADVGFPPRAAVMAASLMIQVGGGRASRGVLDIHSRPRKAKFLVLRHRRIGELLGVDVPPEFVERILPHLGFGVESLPKDGWRVEVPSFRVDIDREADLVEEVARFYGYDRIPAQVTPARSFQPPADRRRDRVRRLRRAVLKEGFDEVINWSFADPEREAAVSAERAPVVLVNPISIKASVLRTTLLPGLLESAAWNLNRGAEGVHIFEVGNVYFRDGEKCEERLGLGILATGSLPGAGWRARPGATDIFVVKGALEALLAELRYEPFSFEDLDDPSFEPGKALAVLCKGQPVGRFGLLKRAVTGAFALDQDVFAAEVDLARLLAMQPRPFRYSPVPKFPAVSRDLSFLVDASVTYQEVKTVLDRLAPPLLESYELTDRFTGPPVEAGKVSLSFRFRYRHPRRTLVAGEVDQVEQGIVAGLKSALDIQLREGKIDNRTGAN